MMGESNKGMQRDREKTEKERDMERYGGRSNIGMERDRGKNRERKRQRYGGEAKEAWRDTEEKLRQKETEIWKDRVTDKKRQIYN